MDIVQECSAADDKLVQVCAVFTYRLGYNISLHTIIIQMPGL